MMNIFGSFSYPILVGYLLSGFFLITITLTTGKRFDSLTLLIPLSINNQPSSRIQRSIQYAFCIFDMGTTGYAKRKEIYHQIDFHKYATTTDIILSTCYCTLFILTSLVCGLCLLIMMALSIYSNILIIWSHHL